MNEICAECGRLWQHYAEAADTYFAVVCQRLVSTAIRDNASAIVKLELLHGEASDKRRAARQAVLEHGVAHDTFTDQSL
jgi:hypothetical protein